MSPESLSTADLRQLQRTLGNRAVSQLLAAGQPVPTLAKIPEKDNEPVKDKIASLQKAQYNPGDQAAQYPIQMLPYEGIILENSNFEIPKSTQKVTIPPGYRVKVLAETGDKSLVQVMEPLSKAFNARGYVKTEMLSPLSDSLMTPTAPSYEATYNKYLIRATHLLKNAELLTGLY